MTARLLLMCGPVTTKPGFWHIMGFDLISDIHIDNWPANIRIDWQAGRRHDVAVVCGDLHDDPAEGMKELARIAAAYRHVIFVDGNHEHRWNLSRLSANRARIRGLLANLPNVHYLADGPRVIDGVAYVGRNGWWDFSFGEKQGVTADAARARFAGAAADRDGKMCDGIIAQSRADRAAMEAEIAALQKDPSVRHIVLATHTPVHDALLPLPHYPPNPLSAGCYGTHSWPGLKAADTGGKIRCAVFGHNHYPQDKVIDGVRFMSHPRGRPGCLHIPDYAPRPVSLSPARPPAPRRRLTAPRPGF